MKRIGISAALLALFILAGCSSSGVQTDFNSALKAAERQKKDVILIVGRSDTDPLTQTLQKDILNSPDFLKEVEKTFVPVFLDIPAGSDIITAEQLEKNITVAQRYFLQMVPSILLLTSDGDVYGSIEYGGEAIALPQFMEAVNSFSAERAERQSAKKAINAASGTEKAILIDVFYENTNPLYQGILVDYLKQIAKLDPENTTGLRSKYDFLVAYTEALNLYLDGKTDAAAQRFMKAAESPYITAEERQSAYGTAVSIYTTSEEKDADKKILDILLEIASETPGAPDYKTAIAKAEGIEKAKLIDEFIDLTDPAFQLFLKDYIREVPTLDPDNTLGLKGKYEYLQAFIDARTLYEQGDMVKASDVFQQAAVSESLSPAQKQEAYYRAAALYPMNAPDDALFVIQLLEKAVNADPANENTVQIQETIDQLKEMMAAEITQPQVK